MESPPFRFKRFRVEQAGVAHPVGTDSVLLGAWADVSGANRVLDIGAGTGIVALMLAQRTERSVAEVQISAVEVHGPSYDCARRNFEHSSWASRLFAINASIQTFARENTGRFDLIVCNPPFFPGHVVSPKPERQISRSATFLSLSELLEAVGFLLEPFGKFCVILPVPEGRRLCEWGAIRGLYVTRETIVYTRPDKPGERLLLQFERTPCDFQRSRLSVHAKGGEWSQEFRALTSDFYLGF